MTVIVQVDAKNLDRSKKLKKRRPLVSQLQCTQFHVCKRSEFLCPWNASTRQFDLLDYSASGKIQCQQC